MKIRMPFLSPLTQRRQPLQKIMIMQYYDQTGFGEPDNSSHILNANDRFFDLL
jgi:hypothetical protein